MALWGFGDTFSRAGQQNLATAGKYKFSVTDLNYFVEQQQRIMGQNGPYVSKQELVQNGMVDRIFELFGDQTAVLGFADNYGIAATEDSIWSDVKADSRFQDVSGSFSLEAYQNYVRQSLRMTMNDYERRIRSDQTISYITEVLDGFAPKVSAFDAIDFSYDNEVRHISWMRLPIDSNEDIDAAITEDALYDYYTSNSGQYFREETREIDVLYISSRDFLNKVEVSDDVLRVYYETIKDSNFAVPTSRSYDEILFATEDQAKASIGVLGAGGLASGLEGFVGVNSRTVMREEVRGTELDQIFSPYAQESQIFGVRQIGNSWAVTRITDIPPVQTRPFEDVKQQVEYQYQDGEAVRLLLDALEPIDIQISSGALLSEIADSLDAPIISLGAHTRDGRDILGSVNTLLNLNAEALEEAFFVSEGEYTDLFEVGELGQASGSLPFGAVILQTRRVSEGHLPELKDIEAKVKEDYLKDLKEKQFNDFKTQRLDELVSGQKGFQETADLYEVDIQQSADAGVKRAEVSALGFPQTTQRAIFDGINGEITAWRDGDSLLVLKIDDIIAATPDPMLLQLQPSASMIDSALQQDLGQAFQIDAKSESGVRYDYQFLEAYKRMANSAG